MTLAIILGAMVGVVMGLTGAGGGIIAVPLLVFGSELTVAQAGPVGLLAVGVAAAVGACLGLKSGIVRYRAALLVATTGVVLAPAGVWLAHRLDTRILSALFAAALVWVAYKSFSQGQQDGPVGTRSRTSPPCIRDTKDGRFIWTSECAIRLAVSGAIAGLLSGLLGVGGGFVMVPALQRYTDLAMRSVVATSLAVIGLISMTSVASSIAAGHFNVAIGVPFAGGAIVGMLLGGVLSFRLSPKYSKIAFGVVCLIVAGGMIYKSLA
jgi:uncharacterized membrane protein YfcA